MRPFMRLREALVRLVLPSGARVTFEPLPEAVLPPEHHYNEIDIEDVDPNFLWSQPSTLPKEAPIVWEGNPIPFNQVAGTFPLVKEQREKLAQNTLDFYGPIEDRRELLLTHNGDKDEFGWFKPITMKLNSETHQWNRTDLVEEAE